MEFEEKTLDSEIKFQGRIITVKKDNIILPDGKPNTREYIEHCGGSCVVCEKDNKILMVKQYRYPYHEELWEIPAGKLNINEDPLETAYRELEEEGGIKADKMEHLLTIYPTPGYSNEKIYIYKASELHNSKMHLDDGEFLSNHWIDKNTIMEMIKKGEIKDGKTLIALLLTIK